MVATNPDEKLLGLADEFIQEMHNEYGNSGYTRNRNSVKGNLAHYRKLGAIVDEVKDILNTWPDDTIPKPSFVQWFKDLKERYGNLYSETSLYDFQRIAISYDDTPDDVLLFIGLNNAYELSRTSPLHVEAAIKVATEAVKAGHEKWTQKHKQKMLAIVDAQKPKLAAPPPLPPQPTPAPEPTLRPEAQPQPNQVMLVKEIKEEVIVVNLYDVPKEEWKHEKQLTIEDCFLQLMTGDHGFTENHKIMMVKMFAHLIDYDDPLDCRETTVTADIRRASNIFRGLYKKQFTRKDWTDAKIEVCIARAMCRFWPTRQFLKAAVDKLTQPFI